jgi:long-chain fatty acid transport protein
MNFSSSPGDVTNRGYDSSWGWGVRIGWTGKLTDWLTLGATYQSKTNMGNLDKYKGLFAEQGDMDVPENYGIGVAITPAPKWTLAADVQRINYGDVKAVGNPVDCLFAGQCKLGDSNGAGFGWRNTTVYKLAVAYEWSKELTLRAGFVTLDQPIPSSQTLFNIIAPGVVENHLTLGATWTFDRNKELSVAYMHAFEKKVNGSGSIPAAFGGGEANLKMYQDALGVAFGWKM